MNQNYANPQWRMTKDSDNISMHHKIKDRPIYNCESAT